MASKRQQARWLKLFNDPKEETPSGWWLKSWLLGGDQIPLSNALFDPADYKGAVISDLFSEDQFFADQGKFWKCQNKAIAERAQAYRDQGWQDVVILDTGKRFSQYEHEKRAKEDGSRVYVAVAESGEVTFHEGWVTAKEAKRLDRAKASGSIKEEDKPVRPELSKAAQLYLDLHRHNAVRCELLKAPSVALRLMVAHAVCGSSLWSVDAEPQNAQRNEAIEKSIEAGKAQKAIDAERAEIKKLLGMKKGEQFIASWQHDLPATFARLLDLDDNAVMRVLTFTMAETLASGIGTVEALGLALCVDMRGWWQPDQCFFDLMRDKEAINAMLAEVAGKIVARDALTATAKVQTEAIRKQLAGEGGRKAPKGWQPRYMSFPMSGYTKRGGVAAVERGKAAAKLFKAGK